MKINIGKVMKTTILVALITFSLITYGVVQAATDLSNCLVNNDIGKYVYDTSSARIGNASGVVGNADHFKLDHTDSICTAEYSNINEVSGLQTRNEILAKLLSVDVQVTQHTGGDSDRWLLHEIERSFRRGNYEEDMVSARFRNIDGNNLFYGGLGGGHYRWLNNNVVVDISYTDLYKQKPEPIEVVKAYLAKFPSTIPNITIDNAHNIQWIKDELDRRLWLCDKWNLHYQAGKATQKDLIYNLVRSMNVFLNYRQKYFDVPAQADLDLLSGYQQNNDIAAIQTKLSEYKGWWNANKAKSISLL